MIHHAEFQHWLPRPLEDVFLFFANPSNMPRIMPAWMQVRLLEVHLVAPAETETPAGHPTLAGAGSELLASYRMVPFLPFRLTSGARITGFVMNRYFEDQQTRGPFKHWHHRHEFRAATKDGVVGTLIRDLIDYDVGQGVLGGAATRLVIGPQLRKTFQYRQRALQRLMGIPPEPGQSNR